jgi:hypothetical protein
LRLDLAILGFQIQKRYQGNDPFVGVRQSRCGLIELLNTITLQYKQINLFYRIHLIHW